MDAADRFAMAAVLTTTTREAPAPPADGPLHASPIAGKDTRGRTALVLAVPALLLLATSIARWMNGYAVVDASFFDQALWLASQGRAPVGTVLNETLLGDHFGPGVLLFVPLYRLIASPVWLLIAQSAAIWWSGYLVARRLIPKLGWRRSALLASALILSPPVAWGVLYDFHPVVLAVPFALASLWDIADGRPTRAGWLGLAAAIFRADVAFATLVGFAMIPGSRRERLRPALALLGYTVIATFLEMSLGRGGGHWASYYAHLGSSPLDAVLHPWRILVTLLGQEGIIRLVPCLAAMGLLALRRPLLALPGIAVAVPNLLSAWGGSGDLTTHRGLAPTILLAVAVVAVLQERPDLYRTALASGVVLSVIMSPFLPSLAHHGHVDAANYWKPDRETLCLVDGIPTWAGVSALNYALPLLSHREHLYLWPNPFSGVAATEVPEGFLRHPTPQLADEVDYVIFERGGPVGAPAGFVEDGETLHLQRFRRAATTAPGESVCAI